MTSSSITTLNEFLSTLQSLESEGLRRIADASSLDAVEAARVDLLGRVSGALTHLSQSLGALPKENRPQAGQRFNATRRAIEEALEQARASHSADKRDRGAFDHTLPGRHRWEGALHPVSIVIDEIVEIFRELGFTIALGPEAEHDWYNFGALNFPADHPAMDLHDTLYLESGGLLRTHTSPVQVRTLQSYPPPVRILAPGNVYRRDFFDATHAPMFGQLEGLAVDEGISFADLKAMLTLFAHRFYTPGTRIRFGPSYFPFTEPSAQMEVEVDLGQGLRWIEILGCGLVHPAVIEAVGLDSERYTGWAFGMGPGRIAMSRYGIPDIRLFYDSDLRFLEQFR